MNERTLPIGITLGDPAGVGPEIICKALAEMSPEARDGTIVFGNVPLLEAAARITATDLRFSANEASPGKIRVAHVDLQGPPIAPGRVDPRGGDAAFQFIKRAVEDALAGKIGRASCRERVYACV